jgi:hypothetical protein
MSQNFLRKSFRATGEQGLLQHVDGVLMASLGRNFVCKPTSNLAEYTNNTSA